MLFRRFHVDLITRGVKTQTRRVWKRCIVKVGRCYPIQVDYRTKAVGYVRVTSVRYERLGSMTDADAHAEGDYTLGQFRKVWAGINGRWDASLMVYAIVFVYVGREKLPAVEVAPLMAEA